MRSRITIVCGFLLFTTMAATPAHAGYWSSFVAWLSDLDPKSGGLGVELSLFCPPAEGNADRTACIADAAHRYEIKSSAAFLLGTLNEDGGTIFVAPVLGIVEKDYGQVSVGAGLGFIHVGGTLVGSVTRPLAQVGRITVDIPKTTLKFRTELNLIPKGFPAGAFEVDSPETGTEFVVGLSVVLGFPR